MLSEDQGPLEPQRESGERESGARAAERMERDGEEAGKAWETGLR